MFRAEKYLYIYHCLFLVFFFIFYASVIFILGNNNIVKYVRGILRITTYILKNMYCKPNKFLIYFWDYKKKFPGIFNVKQTSFYNT